MKNSSHNPATHQSKTRLLDAALHVIRTKGYAATTVDDICHEAGVTKGSLFHHFKSKDDLALGAVAHWRAMTEGFFAAAPYHRPRDPVERLLGYVDLRAAIVRGDLPDYTCLLGTLVQETYSTHPEIRAACDAALASHVAALARDVEAAKAIYVPDATWSAESVGNFMQSVLQGSFIFAKARQDQQVIRESLAHLRRYLELLFSPAGRLGRKPPAASKPAVSTITAPAATANLTAPGEEPDDDDDDDSQSYFTD